MADPSVLIIDDNPGDIALTQEAFAEVRVAAAFRTAMSGDVGLDLLTRIGGGEEARPRLIILDLNLPRLNGLELLTYIRQHPALQAIPTVILTTSNRPQDREQALALGADGYFVKPPVFSDFLVLVEGMRKWVAPSGG